MKTKFLWLGLFLAFPPMTALALRGQADDKTPAPVVMTNTAETNITRIPVEVVAKDGKTEWVMVEVPAEAVPEPGTTLLIAFSSLLLLRRKREE